MKLPPNQQRRLDAYLTLTIAALAFALAYCIARGGL